MEDMFIKAAAEHMALGAILILFGAGGMVLFVILAFLNGEPLYHSAIASRKQLLRSAFEVVGRLFFALAIILSPLSSASAILQATPLVVVLGGVVFFGERVRWQHWCAIALGFLGVLMIVRPEADSFSLSSTFAVISSLGFAGRDLATRAAPPVLTNSQIGIYGFLMLIVSGVILQAWHGELIDVSAVYRTDAGLKVAGAIVFGVFAYFFLTKAMRTGEISVVAPFRYVRLIFALILGITVFGERPDLFTLSGGLVIVLSGIFLLWTGSNRSLRS